MIAKVETFDLKREVLLPNFEIPEQFQTIDDDNKIGENAYLRHLTYRGAEIRYKNITNELKERIDFELNVIKKTGYPGYF